MAVTVEVQDRKRKVIQFPVLAIVAAAAKTAYTVIISTAAT